CHDVSDTERLTSDENWLQKLADMGPLEELTAEQRVEAVEFLRYHGWEVNQIVGMASDRHLFEEKCGLCHSVERAFVKTMDAEQTAITVERMRKREPDWISEAEAQQLVAFMNAGARGVRRPEHRVVDGTPADAFRARCAGCHPLERSYLYLETELEPHWPLLVKRMQVKAPEWINDTEAELIVEYLQSLKPVLRSAN
ncbi:MAG: cytochrome c, partial [Gammaproteobacteria bacterium]|nr:cytochrome c [Gammaproteobacteria bacterium]